MHELFSAPGWWRAAPLSTRCSGEPRLTAEDREYGRLRRALWETGALTGGRTIPLDRWENAGLSPERLDALLAEPATSLADRLTAPEWLDVIRVAWQRHVHPPSPDLPARAVDLVAPLIAWARAELSAMLDSELASYDLDPLPIDHPLLVPPTDQLARMLVPTVALEINVTREEGRLSHDWPEAGFVEFCERLRQPSEAVRFLLEYPVLAAELVTAVRRWIQVRHEFVVRLLADLPLLRETFGLTCSGPADLTDVRFGAGDSHRGGRSVAIVELADGGRLVYKPRSVHADVCYSAMLRWLNQHDLTNPLRPLTILPREGYGWAEFVAAGPCDDVDQVERFFWRQGAYLALFYALCGADLHHENVIAAGEHPVVVDVEALLQATPRMFGLSDNEPLLSTAVKAARDSVLRVGLLPDHVIRVGESGAYGADISGLTGGDGQLSMLPVLVVQERGTDRMRMGRERLPLGGSANRARLGDQPVDLADHRAALVAGFSECYRILLTHRAELLATDGPVEAFRGAPVRTLLRPTATYSKLLGESWHPDLLRDALDRELLFESLGIALKGIDEKDALVRSETSQLRAQDVPLFDTYADSVDLYDGDGVLLAEFFERSGLDAARHRIAALSESDLARQRWFVEASLTGLTVGEFVGQEHARVVDGRTTCDLPSEALDRELAADAAEVVARRLLDSALDDDTSGAPSWLTVGFVGDRYWRVAPTGADLYSGLAGVGLFLAELDAVRPDRGYREPARRIAGHLRDLTDYLAGQEILASTLGGSGFAGLAGLAYVFGELGRLWDDSDLTERSHSLASDCLEAIDGDKLCDLLGGVAGTAMVFAGVHRHTPGEHTLDLLNAVGHALVERRIDFDDGTSAWPTDMETDQPLLGLSHGTSGIALALASVAELTGNGEYAEIALRAVRFERARLSREHRNWPDLRSFVTGPAYRDTWCHGAAGIGLSRAAMLGLPVLDEHDARDLLVDDLELAVSTVRGDLVRNDAYKGLGNDSLCHGDLGLAETLHAAARRLRRPELDRLAGQTARLTATRVLDGELRCGTPDGLTTPGLMLGIAGIGYGLLRTAAPTLVPNVLLLSPRDSVD